MKITVIGCGRWGSFIAWYLNKIKHEVTLYGKESSFHYQQFVNERKNKYLSLPKEIKLSSSLTEVLNVSYIIISINSQGLRSLMNELAQFNLKNKTIVLCMKGIEIDTGSRLSQIVSEHLDPSNKVAVWIGPGHVEEFIKGVPNCMVIDSLDHSTKENLINSFSSDLIRFYYGKDLIGNEIGAASKNVIGIAAGVLDGLGLSSLKGALMSRGTREIARLIKAMGGNELSAYGLCHLGDYEATVFSPYSHNRKFGELLVKDIPYSDLAEGYYTAKALKKLSIEYNVELPISDAVYQVLYENKDVKTTINQLFERSLKSEF